MEPTEPTEPIVETATGQDDESVLAGLEADLAAVEEALTSLDRITVEGNLGPDGGQAAAAQIRAVVSRDRFPDGAAGDGPPDVGGSAAPAFPRAATSELVGDRLVDE